MLNKPFSHLISRRFIAGLIRRARSKKKGWKQMRRWRKSGRPSPPPPVVKQRAVAQYARLFRTRVLIDTGTLLGDMVEACRNNFERIISIELDHALCDQARKRFSGCKHISILRGDSGKMLGEVLSRIAEPCLFWLDGHYSGGVTARGKLGTPVMKELDWRSSFTRIGRSGWCAFKMTSSEFITLLARGRASPAVGADEAASVAGVRSSSGSLTGGAVSRQRV